MADNHPDEFVASFLGKRNFSHYTDNDARVVNATAAGDARMIVGNVNTNTTITGQVKKVKVYQFPEVQVGYSSRIAKDDATIRRWLTSTDQTSIHKDTRDRREPATNQWLIKSPEFVRWSSVDWQNSSENASSPRSSNANQYEQRSDSASCLANQEEDAEYASWPNFIWLHGGVGCGKTILCSSIIQSIRDAVSICWRRNIHLCYFYLSFQGSERGDLSALLRSLLSQISKDQQVPQPIVELYQRCHQTFPTRAPTLLQLQSTIQMVLTQVLKNDKVYFVFDALDEVPRGVQRDKLLEFVSQLPNFGTDQLKVLVTSRNENDIQDALGGSDKGWMNLPIAPEDVNQDIERYVNEGIKKHRSLKRQSDSTKALIREKLIENANGMFRWSALQLSSLKQLQPSTADAIKHTLNTLPDDLNETYVRILEGINKYSIPPAINALKWLVVSKRMLYVEELADASSEGLLELDRSPYDFREAALEPFHLVEMLRDLVEVRPPLQPNVPPKLRRHKITLAHFSVQEFFLNDYIQTSRVSDFSFKIDEAHFKVAQDCLAYLYRFNTRPARLDSNKPRMLDFVLREYAWYNWEKHVIPCAGDESIDDPARRKATILYTNFKSRSTWTDDESSTHLTSWLPLGSKKKFLEHLNMPYFYPDLGRFFETPSGPADDPRWFGNRVPNARDKEIALISILPCLDPEDDLRCQLHIVSLETHPSFKAISYALGPVKDSPIYIGGSKKSVRPQLANIFRNLRLHQEGQQPMFWADAISLEEWQSSESSVKIVRGEMYYTDTRLLVTLTEIFKEAQEVAISLGDEWPGDEQAITVIHRLAYLGDLAGKSLLDGEHISESQLYSEVAALEQNNGWSILIPLLSRMWWKRRWTIQEMVLARSAVLFIGNMAFSFDVIDRFVEAEPLIRTCLDEVHGPHGYGFHEFFDSQGWDNIRNLSRSRKEYNKSGPIDLSKLLWRFRLHTGMYREDVIRTIAPLTWSPEPGTGFEVAYDDTSLFRLDLPEAILEAFKHILSTSKTPDVLCFHSVYSLIDKSDNSDDSPRTWLPALERDASEVQPLVLCMAGDEHPSLFNACGSEVQTYQFADDIAGDTGYHGSGPDFDHFSQNRNLTLLPSRLSLKGADIDTIERVSDAYTSGIRDKAILDFARSLASVAAKWIADRQYENIDENIDETVLNIPTNEAIWRTLLADQYPPGVRLPAQLPHSNFPSSLPPCSTEQIQEFLSVPATHKALRHLLGRRLLLTKKGRIGLAPLGAQQGDKIVIFAGGSVPFVIRGTGERLVGHFIDIPLWNFIGECYIHGIMDGELLASSEEGRSNLLFRPIVLEGEMRKIPESERPPWREKS